MHARSRFSSNNRVRSPHPCIPNMEDCQKHTPPVKNNQIDISLFRKTFINLYNLFRPSNFSEISFQKVRHRQTNFSEDNYSNPSLYSGLNPTVFPILQIFHFTDLKMRFWSYQTMVLFKQIFTYLSFYITMPLFFHLQLVCYLIFIKGTLFL